MTARLANGAEWSQVLVYKGSHKAVLHQIVGALGSSAAKVITLKLDGIELQNQSLTAVERRPIGY